MVRRGYDVNLFCFYLGVKECFADDTQEFGAPTESVNIDFRGILGQSSF